MQAWANPFRHAEGIASSLSRNERWRAAATPTLIAVAVDHVENSIDLVSNRAARTASREWFIQHSA